MMSTYAVSLFPRFDDPRVAAVRTGTWDLIAAGLSKPLPRSIAKKDLPLWSPAIFDGPRCVENVSHVSALVLDVDEHPIPDADELANALSGLRGVCCSSPSATASKPRWRAAIALSRPVTAEEYPRVSHALTSRLPFKVGSASKDPARQWYMPREGDDGYFEWIPLTGEPLDVDLMLALTPAAPAQSPTPTSSGTSSGETHAAPGDVSGAQRHYRRGLYAEYLRTAPACVEGQGGDAQLFRVVQHGAYDLALPVDDVLELVRDVYDPRCSPPWADQLAERVTHKAMSAKTSSTRPRAEPLPADLAHLARPSVSALDVQQPAQAPGAFEDEPLDVVWGGWNRPLPPPVYIVDPIVPEATVGTVVAKGSSLKTWMALSILAAVASGVPWLGNFATTRSPTLLIDIESGRDVIQERVQYLGFGESPELGVCCYPKDRIDSESFWKKLAKLVAERGIRLVIVDSFAAGATGVDENDARAAQPLHLAARFSEATGCSVVFIHHAKKGEGGDERDILRGSGAIFAALDWAFTLVPVDEDRTRMIVRCIKPFRRRPDDFRIALTVDGLKLDTEQTGATTAKGEEIRSAIRALLARGPMGAKDKIAVAIGRKKETVRMEIDAMLRERELVNLPGRGFCLDYPAARRERILAALSTPHVGTPAKLAKVAHVDADEVHAMLRDGELFTSGSSYVANPSTAVT